MHKGRNDVIDQIRAKKKKLRRESVCEMPKVRNGEIAVKIVDF